MKIRIQNFPAILFVACRWLLVSGCLLLVAGPVHAANLFFDSENREFAPGEEFLVSVFLSSPEESINAAEGQVSFPGGLLALKEIRDGGSIINFWVERPQYKERGKIVFSGITPGGYQAARGLLFSLVFKAKAGGSGAIEIRDGQILLNDGRGTLAETQISNFQFLVSEAAPSAPPVGETLKDTGRPEDFKPEIASDPDIFGGKYFLAFATQDKESGIDHYEVRETRDQGQGTWKTAESPYALQDQELRSYIFVKAVDKAGNERIAVVQARNPLAWYERYGKWGIIIMAVVVAIKLFWTWKKNKKLKLRY